MDCNIDTSIAHNALFDCQMVVRLMQHKKFTIKQLFDSARSFESVISDRSNPLLRSNLITKYIADKLLKQISHSEWFSMTDEELHTYLAQYGIQNFSIASCLSKRNKFVQKKC